MVKLWVEKTDDCPSSKKFFKILSRIRFDTAFTFSLANFQEWDKKRKWRLNISVAADFSLHQQQGEFLLTDIQVDFANHLYTLNSIRMSTTHTITQSSESQPLCIVAAARASKAFTQSKWWVELIDWLVFHTTLHIWRVFFSQKNIYSGCRMNTVHNNSTVEILN